MTGRQTSPASDALALDAILKSAAAGIVTIDSVGTIQSINPYALLMFGYEEHELIGKNVSVLMPEPDHTGHDRYISRYLETGESRVMGVGREVTGLRRDATTFPLHLSVGEFRDEGEVYFTGVLLDLTAQKEAERSALRQQALFQSIFDSLPDALIIVSADRSVLLVNPAFERMFGFSKAEVIGQPALTVYECLAETHREIPVSIMDIAAVYDPRVQLLYYTRKNGESFPGLSLRTLVVEQNGEELGYLCMIRDMSQELHRRADLMRAQRMEAIGQLTGGIAHDFNNILTVILGNLELLEPRVNGQELAASLVQEAVGAADMGARLTDRLLTFSRRQHLETARVNLNEFVLGLTELLRRSIGEDIDLSTSLAGDLWQAETDPGQIENAVLNLAINARDAMPDGGQLLIETRNVDLGEQDAAETAGLAPGEYVVLSVSDTGHGMSREVRERAFEPFFTTKEAGKGSGFGLSTIYGFARQSGGNLTIYSESGKGTSVNLYLPRVREAAVETRRSPAAQGEPRGQGETVLVVEDEEKVRRLAAARLENLGYSVVEAASGAQALKMLAAGLRADIVFTDLVMPEGVSGIDLAQEARARWPGIRVLMTSGYSEALVGTRELQGTRLLRKPYRQAELAAAIRDVLDSEP